MHLSEIHYDSISHVEGISDIVNRLKNDRIVVEGKSFGYTIRGDNWPFFNPVLPQLP